MFLDLPSAQEGKAHLDHSLQLVDFLQELSRSVCDAVAMAGNYLRPEARLGLSSLRFKVQDDQVQETQVQDAHVNRTQCA